MKVVRVGLVDEQGYVIVVPRKLRTCLRCGGRIRSRAELAGSSQHPNSCDQCQVIEYWEHKGGQSGGALARPAVVRDEPVVVVRASEIGRERYVELTRELEDQWPVASAI